MNFSNIIQKYFSNLLISIVYEDSACRIFSKVIKNSKLKEKFDKTFEIKNDAEQLNVEVEEYLISLQEKCDFSYVSLLLNSMGQGAIPSTKDEDFKKFNIDAKSVKSVKFQNWSAFASFIDINWINKIYSNVGIDFIYSPFIVLYHLISGLKPKAKATLYMLNQQDSITLAVFKEYSLCFGVFLKISSEESLDNSSNVEDWESEEEEQGVRNLAAFDKETNDDDEEFSDLEDLTSLDTIDNESDVTEFLESEDKQNQDMFKVEEPEEIDIGDIELYGRDIEIYKFLNMALREYYKNPIYESNFLDQMIIFDGYDMSHEIIQGIEDELFLNVQMNKIDVNKIVCDLSMKEANHEL